MNEKSVWVRQIRDDACLHQLPSSARLAALVLGTYMNEDGECQVTVKTLAKGMGKDTRTAIRAKKQLVDMGWLEILQAGGGSEIGRYRSHCPVLMIQMRRCC
jgi:hypothetical protein